MAPAKVYTGSTAALTLRLTNLGPAMGQITIVLTSPGLGLAQNISLPGLASQAAYTKQLQLAAPAAALGTHTITAQAIHGSLTYDFSPATLEVLPSPLLLNFTVEPASLSPGSTGRAALAVRNAGGEDLANLSITFSLPPALATKERLALPPLTLTPAQEVRKELAFTVAHDAAAGDYHLQVTVQFTTSLGSQAVPAYATLAVPGAGLGITEAAILLAIAALLALLLLRRLAG